MDEAILVKATKRHQLESPKPHNARSSHDRLEFSSDTGISAQCRNTGKLRGHWGICLGILVLKLGVESTI